MNLPPRRLASALPRAVLEALAEKYEALVRLRRARDSDEPHPSREELRRWSQAFPGCLRELDRLTAAELAAKAAAVRALLATAETPATVAAMAPANQTGASREESPSPEMLTALALTTELAWVAWIHRYHELVRAELSCPTGSAEARRLTPEERALRASTSSAARVTRPSLRALAQLSLETGLAARELADALFPPRRRG